MAELTSIADLYVELLPSTARLAGEISDAFRRVDPIAAEAGRRWGREIQRGLTGVDVKLEADTAKAKAEIDEASKDRTSTVEVDADTAKAEAQIDAASRDRKATIEVDADTLMSSAQRSFSQLGPAFAGAGTQLSSSLASSGASAASSVGGSLSGAMGPVGSALSATLIAGGVVAAASIAGALSGAIGLIPAGLGGGVAVLGTLVTGLDGVKDAWDAAGKAADSANKDQAEKAKAVASAQKSLRDAVSDEATAQKDVANARKDARQQLEDLNVQLRGGVIDEKSAILDAQAARRDLAQGRFKDAIDYQQAQLRVEQTDQRVLDAHQRNVDLQRKATDANTKGVDGADQVVAANQRHAKAVDDLASAQKNLSDAQSKPSTEMEALATAMGKLSPNAQAFMGTLQGLKPEFQQLKFAVQDSLFAGLGPQIQALTTQYLPVLKTAMSGLAGTMNTAFKDVAGWLSKPETMATIQTIVSNIGSSFAEWSKSLVPFSEAFLTITKVGSGFLPGLGKMVTDGATAFSKFIDSSARTGELAKWMQLGIDTMGELMHLVPVLGKLFLDLAPMAIPTLQLIGGVLKDLEPVIKPIVDGLAGMTAEFAKHPQLIADVVIAFAGWKTITGVTSLLSGLQGISGVLRGLPGESKLAGGALDGLALNPVLAGILGAAGIITSFTDAVNAYTDAHPQSREEQDRNMGVPVGPLPGAKSPTVLPPFGTPEKGTSGATAAPGDIPGMMLPSASAQVKPVPGAGIAAAGVSGASSGHPSVPAPAVPTVPTTIPTAVPAAIPSAVPGAFADSTLLAGVPAGKYLQTQAADLTKGIGDCSSAVEDLINMMDGVATAGRGMSTGNAAQWLTAHGFLPTNTPVPGAFQVGFNPQHMQATLPGGTNFNWGSDSAAANRGIGGTGAWDPAFTQHYYRPGTPNLGQYSVAGMPTVASPYGVSPSGMPLGTQQSPMYVSPAGSSGGQQLGQDILSGFLEIFGFDGTLMQNPLGGGLFQGFKGLMSAITGGGNGGLGATGLPSMGGAPTMGADLPGVGGGGGGGDMFGALAGIGGDLLKGVAQQPFGDVKPGGPAQAPDQQVMMPDGGGTWAPSGGGTATLPSSYMPALAKPQEQSNTYNHSPTYVLHGNPPQGSRDFVNTIDVTRARSIMGRGVPGFST